MGRSPCCDKAHTNKGAWTKSEDDRLIAHIRAHGEGCWRSLPKAAGLLRCGKSCRLRWINYLRPDLKRGNFTEEEDDLIIRLHSVLGNKWSLIAGRLPGRTDNEIKNYWNTHIRRKLLSRGVDPATHRPLAERVASNTTVVSFENTTIKRSGSGSRLENEEEDKISNSSDVDSSSSSSSSCRQHHQQRYRVPDLNLALGISPPFQYELEPAAMKREAGICFDCSLGLKKTEDCSKCSGSNNTTCDNNSFLGLRTTGLLDYRTV